MGRSKRQLDEEEEEEEEEYDEEEDIENNKKKKKSTPPNKKSQKSSSPDEKDDGLDGEGNFDYLLLLSPKATRNPYTDVHRAVLQYFMARKFVDEKDLQDVSTKLGRDPELTVKAMIETLNEKLSNEDMYMQIRLREMLEDDSHPRVYGLINTRSDEVAKEATTLETWQLAMFSACLGLLAKANNGTFNHTEAICAYNALPDKIGKQGNEILTTLQKLVSLGWLRTPSQNFFTAGPRTLLELSEVLRNYGATECPVSKQIVIKTPAYKKWAETAQQ
jgi:hypothetical protein